MERLVCDSQDVEMNSQTEDEDISIESDQSSEDNTTCWYEHPKYDRYWAHHRYSILMSSTVSGDEPLQVSCHQC